MLTADVVVAGGSMAGLASALALSDAGYRVRVLDRAPRPPARVPAGATWYRPTVPQAAHAHMLTSLGVGILRSRAPEVLDRARDHGATVLDLTAALPAADDPGGLPGDADLVTLACRRSLLEWILYGMVAARRTVTVTHGVTVRALALDPARSRVTGVRTGDGTRVAATAVVDATGWRTASRTWLHDAGIAVPADRTEPSHVRGFSRFYRLTGPGRPGELNRGNSAGGIWSHYAGVLHPADGDVFSVTLATLPADARLDGLRHPAAFTAAARATPGLTPWLADGVAEPVSPVHVITCPPNILRGVAVDPGLTVTGLLPVGDAACVTDPLFGRGMSAALAHAFRLPELIDAGVPAAAAEELHRPWYDFVAAADRDRTSRWTAAMAGREPASGTEAGNKELARAALTDGHVARAVTRLMMGLTDPIGVLDDAALRARARRARRPEHVIEPPTRADLLHTVGATLGG